MRKKRVKRLTCGALASAREKEKEKELRWLGRGDVVLGWAADWFCWVGRLPKEGLGLS
jgi:hypothetical protein